jgi:hypothetical protein
MVTEQSTYAEFAELAKTYCALIENPLVEGAAGLSAIRSSLLLLYTAALLLPSLGESPDLDLSIEHPEWVTIYNSLKSRLPIDRYWERFDPLAEKDKEVAIASSLADDLADIWRDLAEGLRELTVHPDRQQSVWWEWRFGFQTHWGNHAVSALRAIHYALQDSY